MNGNRKHTQRTFRRVMVTLLTLVMVAGFCAPAMQARAEGEPVMEVQRGESKVFDGADYVEGIQLSPNDGQLRLTEDGGKIRVSVNEDAGMEYTVKVPGDPETIFVVKVLGEKKSEPEQPLEENEDSGNLPLASVSQSEGSEQGEGSENPPAPSPANTCPECQGLDGNHSDSCSLKPAGHGEPEKKCTCDSQDGNHAEDCGLYAAPAQDDTSKQECTCGSQDGNHAENCGLYVTPQEDASLVADSAEALLEMVAQAETADKLTAILDANEELYMSLDGEQLDAVLAKAATFAEVPEDDVPDDENEADDPATLATPPEITIERGEQGTVTLERNKNRNAFRVKKDGSYGDYGITVTGDGNSRTITVGANTEPGRYTVEFGRYDDGDWDRKESVTVIVPDAASGGGDTGSDGAQVYFLKSPTSLPGSNDVGMWLPTTPEGGKVTGLTYNGKFAQVNTDGAIWTKDSGGEDRNIMPTNNDVAKYVVSWPDGSTGSSWTIYRQDYPTEFEQVFRAYQSDLASQGIIIHSVEEMESITLIPYKISKRNDTNPDYHIDCTISIQCKAAYAAIFHVMAPGDTNYVPVHTDLYAIRDGKPDPIQNYTGVELTKNVNGINYVFDGWYNEAGEKVEAWGYTPTAEELGSDNTVNFYGHYVPEATSLTIRKVFDSLGPEAVKPASISITLTGGDSPETVYLTAANGYTVTVSNLTPGKTYTVAEVVTTAQIENYDLTGTSYSPDGGSITLKSDSTQNVVTITNTYAKKTADVTVHKTVSGNMGDQSKSFTFTYKVGESGSQGTFQLAHGQNTRLANLTIDETLYIQENAEGYNPAVTYTVGDGREQTVNPENGWYKIPIQAGTAVYFDNNKTVNIDTGILTDSAPYLLLLTLSLLGGGLLLMRRRGGVM